MSVALISPHTIFTGPSSFWLVPMSTVPGIEGLHHRKRIAAGMTLYHSHMAHITILGVPGWAPTDYKWPDLWTLFHLGCNPSLQVCCQTGGSESHAFVSEELAGWIGRLHAFLAGHRHHTHPTVLGYLECCTLLSLCALPRWKLKPSTSEDMHPLQETLNPFPEA